MKIVIVGGGFGGVKTALELAKDDRNDVTLISDRPDFQYYPALYSTATGHSHLQSWVPLGEIFASTNVQIYIDTIVSIDHETRILTAESGEIYDYDLCILALGSVTTYFGIEGLDAFSYGIKSAGEIQRLKQHLYEQMAVERTVDKRFVVIGGGPTGVELAASLGTYIKRLQKKYRLRRRHVHIDLIEASPRVLPRMSEDASKLVTKRLRRLGITVMTGKAVQKETVDTLMVSGEPIKSHTVIWTSGVANNPFFKNNPQTFVLAKNGRVAVDEHLKAADRVYVIGDNAATPYGGLAQTALRDALFVARNIKRQHSGKKPKKYKAVMPPVVIPVGKDWAIFSWKGLLITGKLASWIRSTADFVGYSDILRFGQALGAWRAESIMEDDYFPKKSKKS